MTALKETPRTDTQSIRDRTWNESVETLEKIPPVQVVAFLKGCDQLYTTLRAQDITTLFYAQRGAGPLVHVLKTFGHYDQPPQFFTEVPLPIGTFTTLSPEGFPTRRLHGINRRVKQATIARTVHAWASTQALLPSQVALVDEVQGGGTITTAHHYLSDALQTLPQPPTLRVVAAVDNRIHRQPVAAFQRLLTEQTTHAVNLPLFTVDRIPLLDVLFHTSEGEAKSIPNETAALLFQLLALGYKNPLELKTALNRVARNKLSERERPMPSERPQRRGKRVITAQISNMTEQLVLPHSGKLSKEERFASRQKLSTLREIAKQLQ